MGFKTEPTVTLVNRLVDKDGKSIPLEFMFDGESVVITDRMDVPISIARVLVHHSMCRMDTLTGISEYKLGVEGEMGFPVDPLPVSDLGRELVDREKVPIPRQTVKGTKLGYGPDLRAPIAPRASAGPEVINLRDKDGAFPGGFGTSVDIKPTTS